MENRAELVSDLKGWCRGEGLDENRALLVLIPEDAPVAKVPEILQTVEGLGKICVVGRMYNMRRKKFMILCESKEIAAEEVPPWITPPGDEEAWPIIIVAEEETPETEEEFSQKLAGLLHAEGKTKEDLKSMLNTEESPTGPTESILRALGDLLDKMKPPTEQGSYRRLRLFSGTMPTPAGEEQFEHWLEQARLMVEECDCSLKEKRRRLMESLKGPALEIVRAARASDADVGPEECLEALEHAFGTAESGDDLYFAFRLMSRSQMRSCQTS